MKKILTGIQSTGTPHLGNVLGAILPAINAANTPADKGFYFIADLHSLTNTATAKERQAYTQSIAAAWLACGLDTQTQLLYRQSRVPYHSELMWYLACVMPYAMLNKAHAFKERKNALHTVNAGTFVYPVLMAADILLYQADLVPVGKDQLQHIEMTRDVAQAFNRRYGDVFTLPQAAVQEHPLVLGRDGRKMSKSYNNTLEIFADDKILWKQVSSIQTDSTPVEVPKNPDQCTIFSLYASMANTAQTAALRHQYQKGGMGYGEAKKMLFDLILKKFSSVRSKYQDLMHQPALLEEHLQAGEAKACEVASCTMKAVKKALFL